MAGGYIRRSNKRTKPKYRHPRTSITPKSRLLCGDCGVMRGVSKVHLNPYRRPIVTLDCGHKRGEALAPRNGGDAKIEGEHDLRLDSEETYSVYPEMEPTPGNIEQ
jgi:hypothetical protein